MNTLLSCLGNNFNKNFIFYNKNYARIFNCYDEILLKKRFNKLYTLAASENIVTIKTYNLNYSEIRNIINIFLEKSVSDIIVNDENLLSIAKISNIPNLRIEKVFLTDTLLFLCKKLSFVSHETKHIHHDFFILKTIDVFLSKIRSISVKNDYKLLKRDILNKLIHFEYEAEKASNSTDFNFWIKRLKKALLENEISLSDFIVLNKKIIKILSYNEDFLWENLCLINFLCFYDKFNDSIPLKKLKREITKMISQKSLFEKYSEKEIKEKVLEVLSKEYFCKEDFYRLSSLILNLSKQSPEAKIEAFCLCEYIIYLDSRLFLFCNRFIRENFLSILDEIILKEDTVIIKEKEFELLTNLFFVSPFFIKYKHFIFQKIVSLLADLNNKISIKKYNQFCAVLDYVSKNSYLFKNTV